MKKTSTFSRITLTAFLTLLLTAGAVAQDGGWSFSLGADLVSTYVWRGSEFGTPASPHFQPGASLDYDGGESGALSIGTWGSYGISSAFDELDFFISYGVSTSAGDIGIAVTDYTYPSNGKAFGNFDGDGVGAHTIELSLSYSLPGSFPLSILAAMNVHNEVPDENSLYVEIGYPVTIDDVEIALFAGGAQGISNYWYGVTEDGFALINVGFSASKEIAISSEYSLPVFVSTVYNPHVERMYLIFGLSI